LSSGAYFLSSGSEKSKNELIYQHLVKHIMCPVAFFVKVSRKAMERVWRPKIRDDHGSATPKSESAYWVFLNPSKLEGTSILIKNFL